MSEDSSQSELPIQNESKRLEKDSLSLKLDDVIEENLSNYLANNTMTHNEYIRQLINDPRVRQSILDSSLEQVGWWCTHIDGPHFIHRDDEYELETCPLPKKPVYVLKPNEEK